MNSIEYIIDHEGKPWAIDFNNPVPDARREVLGEIFYEDYLSAMAELVYDVTDRLIPDFLPDINSYVKIAQSDISEEEKFQKALSLASHYYQ